MYLQLANCECTEKLQPFLDAAAISCSFVISSFRHFALRLEIMFFPNLLLPILDLSTILIPYMFTTTHASFPFFPFLSLPVSFRFISFHFVSFHFTLSGSKTRGFYWYGIGFSAFRCGILHLSTNLHRSLVLAPELGGFR
jgi:hypothetical protein